MQLQTLKEREQQRAKEVRHFRKTIRQKDTEIQGLSQQILAKEGELSRLTQKLDESKLPQKDKLLLELADMKAQIITLKDELQCECTKAKFAQEETSYYQDHTASLHKATHGPIKVNTSSSMYYAHSIIESV